MSEEPEIRWQDPPPAYGGRSGSGWMSKLRANPGRWALVRTGKKSTGWNAGFYDKRGFECVTRTRRLDDGSRVYDIYFRYVGEPKDGEAS